MAKINPKTARAMYEATVQGNKDKIAKETYGEFGFDTLTYDQQQEAYKKYPKLPRSSKDIGSDFETPAKMKSPLYAKLTASVKLRQEENSMYILVHMLTSGLQSNRKKVSANGVCTARQYTFT